MIVSSELPYMINIGRPSFFDDEQRKSWLDFFNYVEKTFMPIAVNDQFYNMKQMCESGKSYGGGGFKFCFWFFSKKDRKQFLKYLENKLGWDRYRNYEKISLYQDIDKQMYVRMISELVEPTNKFLEDNVDFELIKQYEWDMVKVDSADLAWLVKLQDHLNDVLLDMD